jgi:7,8-dihydropterin-6-yl-methyl-4-(beta-D-ribofuranosyl)aminobenzene 5'-phosphate synthase
MKLYIVIDNNPSETSPALESEHGLCIYFNSCGEDFLIDTGSSGKFISNLENLNLTKIEDIEHVIISHGHNDHTGGLKDFLQKNSKAKITLHSSIKGEKFFSCRAKSKTIGDLKVTEFRSIGMDNSLFVEHGHRFNQIEKATQLSENVTVVPVGCGNNEYSLPLGNSFLYKNDLPDNFSHEVAVLVKTPEGNYAVISPCSHNGILNILEICSKQISSYTGNSISNSRKMIKAFVGGLHYVDYLTVEEDTTKDILQEKSIEDTFSTLLNLYPNIKIYSGHCTCKKASEQLKFLLKDNYSSFYSGYTIKI